MMGGVYSEKDGRQVPDTIAVTFEFPGDLTVLWQSTFSNNRFGLGERLLGSDGTIEHVSGATDMVTGKYTGGISYFPEKANRGTGATNCRIIAGPEPHGKLAGVHSLAQSEHECAYRDWLQVGCSGAHGKSRLSRKAALHVARSDGRKTGILALSQLQRNHFSAITNDTPPQIAMIARGTNWELKLAPCKIIARNASFSAVNGSALISG